MLQHFIIKHKLQSLNNNLPSPQLFNKNLVYYYNTHKLRVIMTDN